MKTSKRRLLAIANALNIFFLVILAGQAIVCTYILTKDDTIRSILENITNTPKDGDLMSAAADLLLYVAAMRSTLKFAIPVLACAIIMAVTCSIALWRSTRPAKSDSPKA